MNRLQRRQAERKPVRRHIIRQPHAQNRLLLVNDPQRLSDKAVLDSGLKLHLYLQFLLESHAYRWVCYFNHFLDNIRTMALLQNRPQLHTLIDQAASELQHSHSDTQRAFTCLKALVCRYSADMAATSATLLVECNDHAAQAGIFAQIAVITALPAHALAAFGDLLQGQTVKNVAAARGISHGSVKTHAIDIATAFCGMIDNGIGFEPPSTITGIRHHKTTYRRIYDDLKTIAAQTTRKLANFQHLFGVALVDIGRYANKAA